MLRESYERDGFVIARNVFSETQIGRFAKALATVLAQELKALGKTITITHARGAHAVDLFRHYPGLEAKCYDRVRHEPEVMELATHKQIVPLVRELIGDEIGLFSKIPFRIDLPLETRELAVWHQDFHYVRGNTDVVTAWVPLQKTTYLNGCLSVMPGSHKLGPVEHDAEVLGKRHFPSKHLSGDIKLVEMNEGDVLFFHSCLLHSGNVNLSNEPRLSIQARYTPLGQQTDESMGEVIPL